MSDRIMAMEQIFSPRAIAFVGASNNLGKWGGIILHNLISGGFPGAIHPVNPKEATVMGRTAYRRATDIPGPVDLAIFTIPAALMPDAISDCVAKGIKAGVVVTAGFGELGAEGKALQAEMVRRAQAGGMVLIGPNGQGIAVPHSRLFPWMPMFKPDPGGIAIVSMSGNVSTFIAEGLAEFGFGCSKAISAGNCADLDFPDYLDYFAQDPLTKVIVLYIEGITDGRRFLAAAKNAAIQKPVVAIKSGRTAGGARAASTHTGALAGQDDAFTAACRQAGVVRADTIEESIVYAAAFLGTPLPKGRRVGVVTGGGGLGVLAADACDQLGLELAPLGPDLIEKIKQHLPPWWAPNNPVDLVAGIGYGGPREIIPLLMESPDVDGVILLGVGWIYSMLDAINQPTDFSDLAKEEIQKRLDGDLHYTAQLGDLSFQYGKPLLMTSPVARLARRRSYHGLVNLLNRNIMLYPDTEDAVRTFAALHERHRFLEGVREEKSSEKRVGR